MPSQQETANIISYYPDSQCVHRLWVWVSIYWLSCKVKYFGQINTNCCNLVTRSFPNVVNITKYGHARVTVLWYVTHMLLTTVYYYVQIWTLWPFLPSLVADPREGAKDTPPRSKFFYFHAVFGNFLQNNRLVHSLWKILGPPLTTHVTRLKHLVLSAQNTWHYNSDTR